MHDFCSRAHANIAMSRGEWPPAGTQGSSGCQLPGCNKWVYRDPYTGEVSTRRATKLVWGGGTGCREMRARHCSCCWCSACFFVFRDGLTCSSWSCSFVRWVVRVTRHDVSDSLQVVSAEFPRLRQRYRGGEAVFFLLSARQHSFLRRAREDRNMRGRRLQQQCKIRSCIHIIQDGE